MSRIQGVIFLCLWGLAVSAQASDDTVAKAEACTQIPSRLERLACFDELFNTPVATVVPKQTTDSSPYPEAFQVAMRPRKIVSRAWPLLPGIKRMP